MRHTVKQNEVLKCHTIPLPSATVGKAQELMYKDFFNLEEFILVQTVKFH